MVRTGFVRRPGFALGLALFVCATLPAVPARAQNGTWVGTTADFNNPANWTPATVPTARATFDNSAVTTNVAVTVPTTLDEIHYDGTKAYLLINNSIFTINVGISNASSVLQSIRNENGTINFVGTAQVQGGTGHIAITNLLGNISFANQSGIDGQTSLVMPGPGALANGTTVVATGSASTSFRDSSSADLAILEALGGTGNAQGSGSNATGGDTFLSFADGSHADGATFFIGNGIGNANGSGAGAAIGNGGNGSLVFTGNSHSDDSTIINFSGVGVGRGGAGAVGTPAGTGAAGAPVTGQGGAGLTIFNDDTHADRSTIFNEGGASTATGGVGGAGAVGAGGAGGGSTAIAGPANLVFNGNSHADGAAITNHGDANSASGGAGGAGGSAGAGGAGGNAQASSEGSNLSLNDNAHVNGATIINRGGDAVAAGGNGGAGSSATAGVDGGAGGNATATGDAATMTLNGNATLGTGTTLDNRGGDANARGGSGGAGNLGAGGSGGNAFAAGGDAILNFNDNSSAGNAVITNQAGTFNLRSGNGGSGGTAAGGEGGDPTVANGRAVINFNGHSTAGSATITNNSAIRGTSVFGSVGTTGAGGGRGGGFGALAASIREAQIVFNDDATGGSAHIVLNAGTLTFNDNSIFGTAPGGGGIIDVATAGALFNDNASLGNGTLNVGDGTNFGFAQFVANATAGSGTINVAQGAEAAWVDSASAGTATINNNGTALFQDSSDAGTARIVNGTTGTVFVNTSGPLGIGSLSGAGSVVNTGGIAVGGLGLTDTFGGVISDAGALTKVGAGTLILTGTNTYTGGTTVSGGTLQFGDGGTTGSVIGNIVDNANVTFDRSDNLTYSNVISGSGSVTQAGPNTLIIAADESYTGGTIVSSGILQVGTGTQGSITGNIVDNALILFGRDDNVTFGGDISGTGSLVKTGGGTLTLTGSNSFTGGTAITNTNLLIGNGGTSGTIAGAILTSNANVIFNRSDASTFTGAVSGDGALIKNGAGTLILTGASTQTGGTTINAGTLQLGNGGTTGSVVGNITDNGALAFNRSDVVTFGAVISGLGGLVQQGPGTLILTNANTYLGGTTISGGTLQLGNGGTTGSVAGDIVDNATLAFNRSDTVTFGGAISGTGALLQHGPGTLILTGANLYTGGTTIDSGTTLQVGNGGTTGSIAGNVVTNGSLVFDRSDTSSFAGDVSGSGTLTKQGAGTLILTGNDNVGATIDAGTLQIGNGGTTGSVSGNIVNRGALVFDRSNGMAYVDVVSGTGSLTQAGAGTIVLTNTNTYSGGTTIAAGALLLGNGGTTGSVAGNIVDNGILAFNRSDNVTFGGIVSGTGGLVQMGPGTLILTNANTYTGGTLISGGILQIGNGGATGAIVGDIFDNSALVFNRSDDLTFAGNISGTGTLTKVGAGTLTFTGTAAHGGGTTISAGTLQIGNGGATGAIAGDIVDNGALVFNRSGALLYAGNISGTGSLTKTGTGTLVLTGAAAQTGGTTIAAGAIMIGNGGTAGSVAGNITDNGILAFNRSDSVTFGGIVSGTGGLVQMGPGTLILTNANTYTGGTLISGGILQIGNGGTTGSILGNIVDNANLTFNRSDAITFGGVISGTGSLTKAGAGTLILTGSNSYTGATAVNVGTLELNGRIASDTNVAAAAALRGTGTIAGTLLANGTITPGTAANPLGTLTVGGNITFAAGSVLVPTINSAGGTSLLQGGALTLNGGQVRPVVQPGGLFLIQTDYRIAAGSGGRTGSFNGVDEAGLPAFLDATMVYTATDAILRLRRNATNFAANAGLTPNQGATSAALDAAVAAGAPAVFTTYAPIYNSLIMASPAALGQQLDQLSGDALAMVPVAAQGAAERFGDRLADHTWSNSSNLWGLIAYADQNVHGDGNAPGFKATGAEVQLGFATSLGERTRLGLSAGWTNGNVDSRGRAASAGLDTWSLGARLRHDFGGFYVGGFYFGGFYLAGQATYDWHRVHTTRALLLAGTATARFDARTWTASGEAGAVLRAGQLSIEPFLRLRHAGTRQDAYAETGPAGALTVAAQDYDTTRLGGGVRLANRATTATILPYAEIGYERELGDRRAALDNDLPGLPAYRVFGTRLGADVLSASAGVEARLGHGVSLFANGGGRWRTHESNLSVHGGLRVVF